MGKLEVRTIDGYQMEFEGCFADVDPEGRLDIRRNDNSTTVAAIGEGKWSWWRSLDDGAPEPRADDDVVTRLRGRAAYLGRTGSRVEAADLTALLSAHTICVQLVDALAFQEHEWLDNNDEPRTDLTEGDARTFDLLQIARRRLGLDRPVTV